MHFNVKVFQIKVSCQFLSCVSQVRIALQMEDGSRLQGSFSCGQSLFEVVAHFSQIGSVSTQINMLGMIRLNIICTLSTVAKQ